jgi:manganese transport protein
MAILVQYATSRLGLATGSSLPELCRARFGRRLNLALWLQGEVVAMATDLAEVTGAAVGLNLLFGIPFALVPLLVISRDRAFLGVNVSNRALTALLACVTALVTSLNIFLVYQALRH